MLLRFANTTFRPSFGERGERGEGYTRIRRHGNKERWIARTRQGNEETRVWSLLWKDKAIGAE